MSQRRSLNKVKQKESVCDISKRIFYPQARCLLNNNKFFFRGHQRVKKNGKKFQRLVFAKATFSFVEKGTNQRVKDLTLLTWVYEPSFTPESFF